MWESSVVQVFNFNIQRQRQLPNFWKSWFNLVVAALILVGFPSSSIEPSAGQPQPVCQSADGLNRFGINEILGWPGLYTTQRLETSIGLMADAGIGWARTNWAWKDLQPKQGPFDYTHLDDVDRVAAEHHIQVLPILTAVPAWSATAPDQLKAKYGNLSPVDRYRPANIEDWLRYVQNVVKRYGAADDAPGSPRIKYWEVWNEENIPEFWPPTPNPVEYLALLKATYQTIKAADPTAKVVLGGLANAGINSDGSNYLQSLYDLGGVSYFDVVSIHYYSAPMYGVAPVQHAVESVRAIMDSHGDRGKPLWLTEIGWSDTASSGGTATKDEIATFLKAVYTAPLPADLIFWYNFRNIFANSPDPEHNFGLVNADFTPKPAYNAYKSLTTSCITKPTSDS